MRIFVGLSGGVDSAVSAALLQRAGAHVTGVFIKGWYPPGMPCTWAEDRRDAMRVAARLRIPFLTFDASTAYKTHVIEYLIAEYHAGRTPNPDIMCNREVKFGAFYAFAKSQGADYIATGHYVRGDKDQRYFLWAVPQHILANTIFPVGNIKKEDVRRLARTYRIPVAAKKDSQGVCFLGNVSIEEFLKNEFGTRPGRAITEEGNVVGKHDGVLLSTIGQRVHLHDTEESGPWFVLAKHIKKNELVVGKTRIPKIIDSAEKIPFEQANWFGAFDGMIRAQYRYRGPIVHGHIESNTFVSAVPLLEIPTPGQSIVFYRNDEILGGGIIAS